MPVRCPPFVHDLGGEYRIEVEGLSAHHEEDVPLPVLKLGRMVRDKPQQVVLRARRQRHSLPLPPVLGLGWLYQSAVSRLKIVPRFAFPIVQELRIGFAM